MITINWAPHSPWVNAVDDPENNPGNWSETRTRVHGQNDDDVILSDLLDPTKDVYQSWRNQLDIVADALLGLQNTGVTVLWRPMQEMNGDWFWWGTYKSVNDSQSYVNVWKDMYQYLTVEKQLNNLLWVYSPSSHNAIPAMARYPGTDYVDVIAATAYSDTLDIVNYEQYASYRKPLAMGEYGPGLSQYGGAGKVDNSLYITRLMNDYPLVSYWVSWHSYEYDSGTKKEKLAIIDNENAQALMDNNATITLEKFDRQ